MIKSAKFTRTLLAAATAFFALYPATGCSSSSKTIASEKPKYLWMCGDGNFNRFASKDSITHYLEKAKETGFNTVVVDVKPVRGKVLYKSSIVPELTMIDSVEVVRDWDYLRYVTDEAHRIGLKVTASACIFSIGSPWWHKGLVYEDSTFDGRTCVEYLPDGSLSDIRNNPKKAGAFLNPVRQDSRDYALSVLKEIVSNYDIDGLALDYCRFPDEASDFSPESREAFEKYLGRKVENFPADIFTYDSDGNIVAGIYYKEWLAFRAGVISDFVHTVSEMIDSVKPEVKLDYWAASWIHAIQKSGQNWASPRSGWCKKYDYGTDAYQQAGFAPYLDNFIVGAYLERVYGPEDSESVEYALNRADSLIMGDCHVIGSIQSLNHSADPDDPHNLTNAVRCCLEKSDGLMVFDIVHIINRNQWDEIRRGIDEYESSVQDR